MFSDQNVQYDLNDSTLQTGLHIQNPYQNLCFHCFFFFTNSQADPKVYL